jgi:hypothetical protein
VKRGGAAGGAREDVWRRLAWRLPALGRREVVAAVLGMGAGGGDASRAGLRAWEGIRTGAGTGEDGGLEARMLGKGI